MRESPAAERIAIALTVNGESVAAAVEPRAHLADFLREELALTGTHLGCEQGVCGACTVMIDGAPARSCLALAVACDGAEVRTIEGFEEDALMARLRAAFRRRHALQCGFCTPGVLATAYDIVRRLPEADPARIRRELSGNLCRCTGYQGMVQAIADVLAEGPHAAALQPAPRTARRPLGARAAAAEESAAAGPEAIAIPAAIEGGETLTRTLAIAAPPERIWPILSDIESLIACIPGASLDEPPRDGRASGAVAVAIGPMKARFRGAGAVRFDPEARTGSAIGRGRDRISRSQLDGALDFALTPDEARETGAGGTGAGGSLLRLAMRYRLSGPLAQLGRPAVVAAVADRLLEKTAAAIAARAAGAEPAPASETLDGLALIGAALRALTRRLWRR